MQHHPLPEYPRPALRRDSYENLNGLWQYAITGSAGLPAKWDGDILVPYSPETKASGVERTLQPGAWLHYHRSFVPPAGIIPQLVIPNLTQFEISSHRMSS